MGLITAACFVQTAVSVPAYTYPRRVQQADGSYITITVRGDEHGHLSMTEDGHPLFFNAATGNYEYATLNASGLISGSGLVAANAAKRTAQATAFLKTQDTQGILKTFAAERKAQISRMTPRTAKVTKASSLPRRIRINDYPTTGNQHSLVILVEFSDKAFSTVGDDANAFYNNMLNQEGFTYKNGANGSARDFYIASSNGQFTPTFDVVGPVKLSRKYSYYGANSGSQDNYARVAQFVKEACTLADPLVDFSQYDTNKDGKVDNIYFFYAGYGEADSKYSNTIWPHAFNYEEFDQLYGTGQLTLDGVNINSYSCSNEINGSKPTMPTGIGTFTHEFGHVLGLGDHYDVEYSSATFDPGSFDIMASGSYNNDGNTPPTFSAYERGELGWLDYTELSANTDTLNVLPDLKDSNKAYRISVPGTNDREFYVLENRQQKGWDKYLPGHGMLMWHIDIDTTAWNNNSINTIASHQRVDLVEADNRKTSNTTSGDPFPGSSNVTRWTLKSWNNKTLLSLDDIEEKDSLIYMLLGGLDMKLPTPDLTVTDTQDDNITIIWTAQPIAKTYKLNVFAGQGNNLQVLDGYKDKVVDGGSPITISGLTPDSDYKLTLVATRGSYTSDTASVNIHTTEIPFGKLKPEGLAVLNATGTSITAQWQAVKDADNYVVTLMRHSLDSQTLQQGYDFTQRMDGMPALWKSNATFVTMNGYYGEAGPALRLLNNDEYLLAACPDAQLNAISFWARSRNAEGGTLAVETANKGVWTEMASIDLTQAAEGKTYEYSFAPADSVRLVHHKDVSTVFIDDVTVGYQAVVRTPVAGFNNIEVGNTLSYTFTGLDKYTTYGFTVYAKQGNSTSALSDELPFLLMDFPAGISTAKTAANQDPVTVYDLNGRRVNANALTKGLYIFKQDGKGHKVMMK